MNPLILEKYAAQFRAKLGYSNKESIHLKSLLHKPGVLAVFRPLEWHCTKKYAGRSDGGIDAVDW